MPLDRKRLLGYVETIQLILGVTDKRQYEPYLRNTVIHTHNKQLHVYLTPSRF